MKKTILLGTTPYPNIWLSPMAGDGDRAFRLVCHEHGAGYLCSEMVSAKALCYGDKKTPLLAKITPAEAPMAVQIFGSEPEFMARGAQIVVENAKKDGVLPSAIDINMGCPVHKVVSNGEGSALMKNVPLIEKIVSSVVRAVDIPVTVKMRLGWDQSSINVVEAAKAAEAGGAAAVCVHARTRAQMYSPGVDISYIAKVKSALKIPVIGNGDVFSADDAKRMFAETGCDGVAVARGALGNPWIFEEISAKLCGSPFTPPTVAERIETAKKQLQYSAFDKGERVAAVESRRYIGRYLKGINGASKLRAALCRAETVSEIISLLSNISSGDAVICPPPRT